MNEIIVLKLGGSVVTRKSEAGIIDTVRIHEFAAQIAPIAKSVPLVIVHGAGSCGHPEAKAYHIQDGVSRENAEGAAITHFAVRRLNEAFVSVLRNCGVDAVCMHPFCNSLAKNGRLVYSGEKQVKAMLNLGIVPVLHGDVVMDTARGACIVSGDQVVSAMAKALVATPKLCDSVKGQLEDTRRSYVPEHGFAARLHGNSIHLQNTGVCSVHPPAFSSVLASRGVGSICFAAGAVRVGVATDVSGVFSGNSVVPVITRCNVGAINLGNSKNTDVTGGMRGKIEELLFLADAGISSHLFHISRVVDFLEERDHGGTIVR
ncbi:MAG: isopentenyl phosphate kinase family protein [Methanocalculaceae archaeon]|nr:isopentenyl phosphate kinase family protein [Methanocalculaceae archaeon]